MQTAVSCRREGEEVGLDTLRTSDVLLEHFKLYINRVSHIEQLLLGIATLGVAGWAFLLVRKKDDEFSEFRLTFTILFSTWVSAAYNMVYVMMTAHDILCLRLERQLSKSVLTYQTYYSGIQLPTDTLYYVTAMFLPGLSFGAVVYSSYEIIRNWIGDKVPAKRLRQKLIVILPVVFLVCFMAYTCYLNLWYIGRLDEEVAKGLGASSATISTVP
jgi:ABC-type Fe3+-siderophore transport system permease subunit